MKQFKMTLFALVLISFFSQPGYPIELKTSFQTGSYPRFYIDERDGKQIMAGMCVDIMKAFEQKAPEISFSYHIRLTPFERIRRELENNTIQAAFGIARTPERENIYQYADTPIYPMKYVIFALADDKKARQIRTYGDMRDHGGTMLGIRGTHVIKTFRKETEHLNIPVEVVPTMEQNLKKMLRRRGSFFIYNDIDATGTIKKMGWQDKFVRLPIVIRESHHWLGFSGEVPQEVVRRANAVLKDLEEGGELQKIYEKYMK